jgi:hypothetical protein
MTGEETSDVKKKYMLLQEKYALPDYKLVNKELELSALDSHRFLLRQIRKRIHHRIEDFSEILEDLLMPDSSISQMHEYRFFSDRAKNKIYLLYRKLMHLDRHAMELQIIGDGERDAEYIKSFFSELEDIKSEMLNIAKTMKNSWKRDIDKDIKEKIDKQEYFG